MFPLRSLLFVPASRPALLPKALSAGADLVCADLEDAVALCDKASARVEGVAFLHGGSPCGRALRINSLRSRFGLEDVLALQDTAPAAGIVCLPKIESAEEVRWAAELLRAQPDLRLAACIETTGGLREAFAIAAASLRLEFILFGAADLCAEMNIPIEDEALAYARGRLAHAAHAASINLIDVPCLDFRNFAEVERQARLAKRFGFTGKAAIHPSNIATINAVFSPTRRELEEAQAIVAAFQESNGAVTSLNGKVVEEPIVKRMIRLIEDYSRRGSGETAVGDNGA